MWEKKTILHKITTDNRWLERGVLAIYAKQTIEEQRKDITIEHNNIGFNGADATFLSSIAQQLQKGRVLTDKQIFVTRKMMCKYAGQLTNIANGVS
jgi:hypothetical protein